jgi:hypothetical protein
MIEQARRWLCCKHGYVETWPRKIHDQADLSDTPALLTVDCILVWLWMNDLAVLQSRVDNRGFPCVLECSRADVLDPIISGA